MISVLQLKTSIQKALWTYFSTEAHKDNDIQRYINSAVRDIVIQKNFDFNNYTIDVEVLQADNVVNIPFQIETYYVKKWEDNVSFYNFKDYYSNNHSDWVGIFWDKFISKQKWTYTVFYKWYPKQITELGWNIDIPEHFFDLIVLKATYFWFMDIRAYQQAQAINWIYDWMIKSLATRSTNKFPLKRKTLNSNKVW